MRMNIVLEKSVENYIKKVEPLLLGREANNNLLLGILQRARIEEDELSAIHLGLVEKNGTPIYAFLQTPPNNWILGDVENIGTNVIHEMVLFLHNNQYDVPGVIGPAKQVDEFVKKWQALTSNQLELHMNQFIYQLDKVRITPNKNGKLIKATSEHESTIAKWLYFFGQEAKMSITKERAKEMAKSYITNQSVYLWEVEGQPVSMVNNSRRTKNGVTVNAVYTPDEHKRKGYATNAVAALSQKLLDTGFQFCSLYTDAANPTSNNIYKKIGYYETGTSVVYKLGE